MLDMSKWYRVCFVCKENKMPGHLVDGQNCCSACYIPIAISECRRELKSSKLANKAELLAIVDEIERQTLKAASVQEGVVLLSQLAAVLPGRRD